MAPQQQQQQSVIIDPHQTIQQSAPTPSRPLPPARLQRMGTGSAYLNLLENDPDNDTNRVTTTTTSTSTTNNNSVGKDGKGDGMILLKQQQQQVQQLPVQRDSSHFVSTLAAGVGSGFISSVIVAPLDLVRTRMQVWNDIGSDGHGAKTTTTPTTALKEILQKEGWKGLFRGLGATLVTVPLFWGVYFPLYEETKHYVKTTYPTLNPSVIHCGSAVFTGGIADLVCNPLFLVRTRLQTQALHQMAEHQQLIQSSMIQTAKELYIHHGSISVFWRGMTANLMGLSHVAVQFPTYEFLKKQARERRNDGQPETAVELLVASGLAKMCASLLSYPHEVLRSRMMDSRAIVAPTLTGTIVHIWKQEGFVGYYTGLPVTLIRVIPNCCVTFVSYEFLARWSKEQWMTWQQR